VRDPPKVYGEFVWRLLRYRLSPGRQVAAQNLGVSTACRSGRDYPRGYRAAPETAQRSMMSGLRAGSLPCDRGGARVLVVAPRRTHEPQCVFCCAFRRLPVHSFCRCRFPAFAHKIRLMRLMRKTAEPGDVEPGLFEDSKERFERVKT